MKKQEFNSDEFCKKMERDYMDKQEESWEKTLDYKFPLLTGNSNDLKDFIKIIFKSLRSKDRDTLIERIEKEKKENYDGIELAQQPIREIIIENRVFNSALNSVKQIILEVYKNK
jgi:hypothetical protein